MKVKVRWMDCELGPLIIMMFKMLRNDLVRFMCVFCVCAGGLVFSFVVMFQASIHRATFDAEAEAAASSSSSAIERILRAGGSASSGDDDTHMFADFTQSLTSIWRLSLGDFEFGDFDGGTEEILPGYEWCYKLLWFFALMILSVLLLNMLIAAFSDTFSAVIQTVTLQAYHSKARVIRQIEHQMPNARLRNVYEVEFTSKHEIIHDANEYEMDGDSTAMRELGELRD